MKEERFQHNGEDYCVRIVFDGITYHVRAFKDGIPANGYKYSVDTDTAFDLFQVIGYNAIQDLVSKAIDDVKEECWEKYLEALKVYHQKKS